MNKAEEALNKCKIELEIVSKKLSIVIDESDHLEQNTQLIEATIGRS